MRLFCSAHCVALIPPSTSCTCAYLCVGGFGQVAPNSDFFQTLMAAMMELSPPPAAANAAALQERSVNAVISAWDKETSQGLHLRLLQGDHEGAQVR